MKVTVKDRQSLLDVAIQVLGSAEGVLALAERNGISITDRLTDGQVLEYDTADIVDSRTTKLLEARGICPVTEIPTNDERVLLERVDEFVYIERPHRPWFPPGFWDEPLVPLVRPAVLTNIGTTYDSGVMVKAPSKVMAADNTPEENVLDATINKAMAAASKNEAPPAESGQATSSIFTNQFNDTFA